MEGMLIKRNILQKIYQFLQKRSVYGMSVIVLERKYASTTSSEKKQQYDIVTTFKEIETLIKTTITNIKGIYNDYTQRYDSQTNDTGRLSVIDSFKSIKRSTVYNFITTSNVEPLLNKLKEEGKQLNYLKRMWYLPSIDGNLLILQNIFKNGRKFDKYDKVLCADIDYAYKYFSNVSNLVKELNVRAHFNIFNVWRKCINCILNLFIEAIPAYRTRQLKRLDALLTEMTKLEKEDP